MVQSWFNLNVVRVSSSTSNPLVPQEPDDILPIMPPSGSGSNSTSLFPDLNLNEQEWSELMEELNCTVAYEDIQDILNDDFEDRKDPLDLAPAPGSDQTGGSGAGNGGAGSMNSATGNTSGGRQGAQTLLPPDLSSIKTEFSPASLVGPGTLLDQDMSKTKTFS